MIRPKPTPKSRNVCIVGYSKLRVGGCVLQHLIENESSRRAGSPADPTRNDRWQFVAWKRWKPGFIETRTAI